VLYPRLKERFTVSIIPDISRHRPTIYFSGLLIEFNMRFSSLGKQAGVSTCLPKLNYLSVASAMKAIRRVVAATATTAAATGGATGAKAAPAVAIPPAIPAKVSPSPPADTKNSSSSRNSLIMDPDVEIVSKFSMLRSIPIQLDAAVATTATTVATPATTPAPTATGALPVTAAAPATTAEMPATHVAASATSLALTAPWIDSISP
jgi:hypothetical protein